MKKILGAKNAQEKILQPKIVTKNSWSQKFSGKKFQEWKILSGKNPGNQEKNSCSQKFPGKKFPESKFYEKIPEVENSTEKKNSEPG